ncbi:MAG TPA: Ig-like domain-containing protein [Gemmatimonadaceae bacterium]
MSPLLRRQRLLRAPVRSAATLLLAAGAGLTCDAGQALAPAGAEPVLLAYAGPPTIALGDTVALAVVAERGGAPLASPRLLVTSSDSTVLAVRADGDSLVARRRGEATLTVRLVSAILPDGGSVITQPIRVTAAQLTVSPATLLFTSIGDEGNVSAEAVDAGDVEIDAPIAWRSTAEDVVVVDSRGHVRAVGAGTAQIEARIAEDGMTAAATVEVRQVAQRVVFVPEQVRFDALQVDTTFAVEARDANGNAIAGVVPTLVPCNPSIATLTAAGALRSVANGETCIVARADGADDTLTVTVDQQAVRVTVVAPSGLVIRALGGTVELEALAYDRTDRPIGDTPPRWYLHPDDAGNARVDTASGVVEGLAVGPALIVAAVDTATATVTVTVRNDPDSAVVDPADTTFTSVGDAAPVRARVFNERGALVPDAPLVWRTLDPAVASVSAAGLVTGLVEGTARIVADATDGSGTTMASGTALVRVRNVPVTLVLTPELDTLPWIGFVRQLSLDARNARGDALDPASFDWRVDDPAVATVSSTGSVTARAVGETWVRVQARYGVLEDAARIVVTNDPMSLTIDSQRDTLTALGQVVQYTATVRNGAGDVLAVPVTWSSSAPLVASVDVNGRTTVTGYGEATITATAGSSSAAVAVTVLNPTRMYVDNGVVATPRVGTLKRPFLRIADALAAADAFDTVVVRRGAAAYAEGLHLTKRVTILGDSTDFVAFGRDSLRLPVLAHDVDTAGIAASGVPVTIRYLAIRHSLDGPAIATRGADVDVEWIYVNPARDAFATGRGIVVADAPSVARLRRVWVADVRGAGIRLTSPTGGELADVTVRGVRAASGASGAGIEVTGGSGTQITRALVRSTAGPQILVDGADATALEAVDLAGESQLLAVRNATGATQIDAPRLDMRRQTGDAVTGNSETDGRSGLEIRATAGVTVRDGIFTDASGATSKMDAVRLVDARGGLGGPAYGVRIESSRFTGGRYAIRSERSTLELAGSRLDGSALLPISLESADTARLTSDTLVLGAQGCVRADGAVVRIAGSLLDRCGTLALAALSLSGGALELETTELRGSSGRVVAVSGAQRARVRSVVALSAGGATAGATGRGAIELAADEIEVAGTRVEGFAAHAGIDVDGLVVRVDSNAVTRSAVGLRFVRPPTSAPRGNDLWDNVTAGAVNDDPLLTIAAPENWWGDARGPEGLSDPDAVGDMVFGGFDLLPLRAGPRTPGSGTADLRKIRGDGQVAPVNVFLAQNLSVRVVDAGGRAVAGALVTFESLSSRGTFEDGSRIFTASSNASGLAEARLRINRSNEQVTVRVTATGSASTLTFTASTP